MNLTKTIGFYFLIPFLLYKNCISSNGHKESLPEQEGLFNSRYYEMQRACDKNSQTQPGTTETQDTTDDKTQQMI